MTLRSLNHLELGNPLRTPNGGVISPSVSAGINDLFGWSAKKVSTISKRLFGKRQFAASSVCQPLRATIPVKWRTI
ncbi:hypothetical protein CEXT_244171 [Caerostris extrusa]|uniref:Uncharacterized protein n=1 Tax=Caerostris extrusa TaxID=172846 RepID=A0AAV4UVU4_CAEEX|nr:hypothetical protein CEXT_244171 [Caerostris extrusa]